MTKSDDRMLWVRNLECNAVLNSNESFEVEIGSECQVNGILDYGDGAIRLGALTLNLSNEDLYKYTMQLRRCSLPTNVRSGKQNGYLFKEGEDGELLALISLFLQARFYKLSTTLRPLTSHGLPIKTELRPLRVRYGRDIDQIVFSNMERNFDSKLSSFLDQVRLIPSKYHLAVALSSNHYARALREVGVDEEMVFVRLVSAIEAAALNQTVIDDDLSGKAPEELFRVEKLTTRHIQELMKLLRTRKAKARFIAFLQQFSEGFFEGMPANPPHTHVTPMNLASMASAVYDARSDYLHNGYPMYLSHFMPAFPDWHMDPSLGMTWQDKSYTADQKLPFASFFHRLVRHCLLSYFESLVADLNDCPVKARGKA
jgi:hypothetical protein